MLIAVTRFIARSSHHTLSFYKLLRKEANFEWTQECEKSFVNLNKLLAEPSVLTRPNLAEVLYLYLSVLDEAVNIVLFRKTSEVQKLVYFISKVLQAPKHMYY